jgi:Homeodomain-like domain
MKAREVILRAIAKRITWDQAADVLGISYSSMWRLRALYQRRGYDGLWVRDIHKPRQKHVPLSTVEEVLLLYQEKYQHLSVRCFYEKLPKKYRAHLSFEWVAQALRESGVAGEASVPNSRPGLVRAKASVAAPGNRARHENKSV